MDEGVDPKILCRQIVTAIDEHAKLESLADAEIQTLFIDWMEELEKEILDYRKVNNTLGTEDLIKRFKISHQGAEFLIKKMKQEGKL